MDISRTSLLLWSQKLWQLPFRALLPPGNAGTHPGIDTLGLSALAWVSSPITMWQIHCMDQVTLVVWAAFIPACSLLWYSINKGNSLLETTPPVAKAVLHTGRFKAEGEGRQFWDQSSYSCHIARSWILPFLRNKSGQEVWDKGKEQQL